MTADEFLTTATAALALVFSLALFDQWRERRGAFQLAWGLGMLFFGIAAATEAIAAFGGWNSQKGSSEDLNRLGSWLGAMAQSNVDASPEVSPPAADLRTASALGKRIAEITQIHVAGLRVRDRARA